MAKQKPINYYDCY